MFNIAILAHHNTALFELACATELFATARPEIKNWYRCEVISFDDGNVNTTTQAVSLKVKHTHSLQNYDFLIIPSWPVNQQPVNRGLIDEIVQLHERGGRIISFCSGAFLLGETGLLDHKQATTHWRYADAFKQRYPNIRYIEDHLYVYDGNVGCSAGSAAALDLGLQVIREDYGYDICNSIARRLVIPPHRQGGQSQFVETPVLRAQNHFAETLDWATKHIAEPLSVDLLAQKANMSRRTFDRKFRAALNMSPKHWLIQQRIQHAQHLLETTQQPIERIAINSGFENALTLRHHFRDKLHTSPTRYRSQFAHCSH